MTSLLRSCLAAGLLAAGLLAAGSVLSACQSAPSSPSPAQPLVADEPYVHAADTLEAGRYLADVAGCHDCHTPGFMENGPNVPEEQWFTGMPIGFLGPWGTSYPANLRLSVATYPEDVWVNMLQTRNALPPMPWPSVHAMSERDLRALYAYFTSLGEAGEPAPQAVPPGEEPTTPYFDFMPKHMERLSAMAEPNGEG